MSLPRSATTSRPFWKLVGFRCQEPDMAFGTIAERHIS
jgi:hypothetical protein